jgi:uncharacterized protein (DUF4415 family)
MTDQNIKRVSLTEIRKKKDQGKLYHDQNAPEGEALGSEFWAKAQLVEPKGVQPVLLKLDPDVLDFFRSQGKGHLTRMQNVLRAYVAAHR